MRSLEVGKKYKVTVSERQVETYFRGLVTMPEENFNIEVLEKPKYVKVDGKIELLPEHLASEGWYLVKSLHSNFTRWFCTEGVTIVELK